MTLCECGCGQEVKSGNRFIYGHARVGKKHSPKTIAKMRGERCTIICEQCRKSFSVKISRKNTAHFCSRKCYAIWMSENRIKEGVHIWAGDDAQSVCKQCGKTFKTRPAKRSERVFCSIDCQKKYVSANMHGSDNPNWKGGECRIICTQCGNTFSVERSKKNSAKFCSRACYAEWRSENKSGSNSHMWKGGKSVIICDWCGKSFEVIQSATSYIRFCSEKCFGNWASENYRGENNPNWRGGNGVTYCELWNEELRERIRNKYNRECFLCNKSEEENKRKLSVHHVNYGKMCMCDYDCRLVPLCMTCHSKTNGNRYHWFSLIMCKLNLEFSAKFVDSTAVI